MLSLILLPLLLGYAVKLTRAKLLQRLDQLTTGLVLGILLVMGANLATIDRLGSELLGIGQIVALLVVLTFLLNVGGLICIGRWLQLRPSRAASTGNLLSFAASLPLILPVGVGLIANLWLKLPATLIEPTTNGLLMLLLLVIGMQLRASNIRLRQILLNPAGVSIAAVVLLSSLIAGALTAFAFALPTHHGLALAAGAGWYSLSGVLIGAKLGPVMGSIAFLADLVRELIAFLAIPLLMRRYPASAIGYGGATAMDCTLPIIQRSGGSQVVPVAIISGFLLSVAGPVLISLFLSWSP